MPRQLRRRLRRRLFTACMKKDGSYDNNVVKEEEQDLAADMISGVKESEESKGKPRLWACLTEWRERCCWQK